MAAGHDQRVGHDPQCARCRDLAAAAAAERYDDGDDVPDILPDSLRPSIDPRDVVWYREVRRARDYDDGFVADDDR